MRCFVRIGRAGFGNKEGKGTEELGGNILFFAILAGVKGVGWEVEMKLFDSINVGEDSEEQRKRFVTRDLDFLERG